MRHIFYGDNHGNLTALDNYKKQEGTKLISVGDYGFNFCGIDETHDMPKVDFILSGNHDGPSIRNHPKFLGRYGFSDTLGFFFVSGALSIDKAYRTPHVSWWPDEELSYAEAQDALILYKKIKPRVIVSHDVAPQLAKAGKLYQFGPIPSLTASLLGAMYEEHKPEIWIHGHYHISKTFKVGVTTVHSLGIDEFKEIEF